MKFSYYLGVDMSKEWFHFDLIDSDQTSLWSGQVDNTVEAIKSFLTQLGELLEAQDFSHTILCVEHTGIYTNLLVKQWLGMGAPLSLVDATQVSRQLVGTRGWLDKTDALDAARLAQYAWRFNDQLLLFEPTPKTIKLLRALQRQRDRLLKAIQILVPTVEELAAFDQDLAQVLNTAQQASIKSLKEDLAQLEEQMKQLIQQDEKLNNAFQLICSVEGIGPVTARELLIATEGFQKFKPHQAKSFARYAGVIPHKRQSGKRVKKKDRIARKANMKIKELLTLGAQALMNSKQELGLYYRRKRQEGKDHYCVINAMRNKMILRAFAVVRNNAMYQKNLNLSLH